MGDGVRDMGVVPERGEVGGERWGLAFEWHGDDGVYGLQGMDGWVVCRNKVRLKVDPCGRRT